MFVLPRNVPGLLVQRAVILFSIFPTSLTDSSHRRGTGGEIASGKVNADRKITTVFSNYEAKSQGRRRQPARHMRTNVIHIGRDEIAALAHVYSDFRAKPKIPGRARSLFTNLLLFAPLLV